MASASGGFWGHLGALSVGFWGLWVPLGLSGGLKGPLGPLGASGGFWNLWGLWGLLEPLGRLGAFGGLWGPLGASGGLLFVASGGLWSGRFLRSTVGALSGHLYLRKLHPRSSRYPC